VLHTQVHDVPAGGDVCVCVLPVGFFVITKSKVPYIYNIKSSYEQRRKEVDAIDIGHGIRNRKADHSFKRGTYL